jgi:hypothetical protein
VKNDGYFIGMLSADQFSQKTRKKADSSHERRAMEKSASRKKQVGRRVPRAAQKATASGNDIGGRLIPAGTPEGAGNEGSGWVRSGNCPDRTFLWWAWRNPPRVRLTARGKAAASVTIS